MTKSVPMMPWFPRDYICATRHFSLAERGAYTDLLFLQWDIGPLPNDPTRLARLIGCTADEFNEVWPAIRDKFEDCLDGTGAIVNRRVEEERRKYLKYREKQSQKALKRWGSRESDGDNVIPLRGDGK